MQFLHEPTKFWETLPNSKGTSILKGCRFEEEEGNVWTHKTTETSHVQLNLSGMGSNVRPKKSPSINMKQNTCQSITFTHQQQD